MYAGTIPGLMCLRTAVGTVVGDMDREPRVPLTQRLSPRDWVALDVLLALVLLAGTLAHRPAPAGQTGTGWDLLRDAAALVACLPLAVRRRWPGPVLALVAVGDASCVALGFHGPAQVGVAFAMFTYAVSSPRRVPLVTVGAVVGVMLAGALVAPGGPEWAAVIAGPAVVLVGWFAGENARARRAYAQSRAERAAERERERAERIRQAATDERLRIARELHDEVAHAMSVIAVQAGAGRMVIDTQPEKTREALTVIETTSRRALREMRRLVGVLRADDTDDAVLEPAPGLGSLDELVLQTERAGVHVDIDVAGDAPVLPSGVEVSAYRIVQEALTNVVRHAGPTTAHVHIRYRPHDVEIEVVDDGPAPHGGPPTASAPESRADDGSGHGLAGMRERVAMFGGDIEAAPAGRGYRVRARLPIED
jgi:signal transduction histidine kinase